MRLRWPLPALLGWSAAWGVLWVLRAQSVALPLALSLATLTGLAAALMGETRWRRFYIAIGFPLSALLLSLSAGSALPAWSAWTWLAPLALLMLLYPLNAWRDAPLYPTPEGALFGLAQAVPLPAQAAILDAGCGLGAGLRALHQQYPQATLQGLESSWLLSLLCRRRCAFAAVRRGSFWEVDWSAFALVYLFQRPETMSRAAAKAAAEMPPGSWLVSLEFPIEGQEPWARLEAVPDKPVWVYRLPLRKLAGTA